MAAKQGAKLQVRRDWPALRQEFIHGEWATIEQFYLEKKIPLFYLNQKVSNGLVRERDAYRQAVVTKAAEKSLQLDVEDATQIRLRQARVARYMQLKGAEALKEPSMKVNTVEDARKLITSGLEQERRALGLDSPDRPNSLTQINITAGPKTQLDQMLESASYEDVLGLIAELKRAREGRILAKTHGRRPPEATGKVQ